MKIARLHLLICLTLITGTSLSQSKYYTLGVSSHFVNFKTNEYFPGKNWQSAWGPTKFSIGIPLSDKMSIMPTASFGKANITSVEKKQFWNIDANLRYDLTQTRLQPYAMAGVGISHINEKEYGALNAGLGLNFWIIKNFGLNAQTNYNVVPKLENYFQNSVGIVFRISNGPKDSDKDGIPDDHDACPKLKGSAGAQGCPDGDGDGTADKDDLCPSEAGTVATRGCPDADGDGIANAMDSCPTLAGSLALNGCPDMDGDGIADKDDSCPTEKGSTALKGCPDGDGDGIADKDDSCPTEKGSANLKGCPDRDGDGVADNVDGCPDQSGTLEKNGCPEIKAEEVKEIETKLNIAAKKIQFETGSAKIKQTSFREIDQIVLIMKQYAFTRFDIEGHTDNTGKIEINKSLSQQRADAVKNYITSKDVSADRLQSNGFGPDRPITTNATAAGRSQNRRVEIHLHQ